jgi:hypothetical protein
MSAFVVFGRMFDQDQKSLHNIDKLLTAVSNEIGTLSQAGPVQRRIAQSMDPQPATAYVADNQPRRCRQADGKDNGIAPDITPATFDLPPVPGASKAGERMHRESADLLYGILHP